MSKIGTIVLSGASGSKYTFNVYPYNTSFLAIGAIYYVSKRTEDYEGNGKHSNLYIGQTHDLSERFEHHHKEACFLGNNANCISIFAEDDADKRIAIESDLIDGLNPTCNG